MAELMHAMGFTIVENVQLRLRNWKALALPGGRSNMRGRERECLSMPACDVQFTPLVPVERPLMIRPVTYLI